MDSNEGSVTRIVLVRHGQSDFNEQALFQGSSNKPRLTPKGWATAAQCGKYLSNIRFDAILCSPLRRAEETAKSIASEFLQAGRQLPPVAYDLRLREIHLPGWEGLPFSTVRERYPLAFHLWKKSPYLLELQLHTSSLKTDSFYPLRDVCTRSKQFLEDTLSSRRGQNLLVVGHGAAISALLCCALGISHANIHHLQQSNGGISALEISGSKSGEARMLFVNRTQHLGEVLPKIKGDRRGIRVLLLTREYADSVEWSALLKGRPFKFIESSGSPALGAEDFIQTVPGDLNTLAWMVPEGRLSQENIIRLRLDMWNYQELRIQRDAITVLHYPHLEEPPVLQAMNVSASKDELLQL